MWVEAFERTGLIPEMDLTAFRAPAAAQPVIAIERPRSFRPEQHRLHLDATIFAFWASLRRLQRTLLRTLEILTDNFHSCLAERAKATLAHDALQ